MEGEEGIDFLLASLDRPPQVKKIMEQSTFKNINSAELIAFCKQYQRRHRGRGS